MTATYPGPGGGVEQESTEDRDPLPPAPRFDLEIERFLSGPAPYGSGNPVATERPSYPTAERELADALEGTAPRLAHDVAGLIGPHRTAELAQVIRRAVAVGIRRRGDLELAERMHGVYDLLASGLDQVTDGCSTSEVEQVCSHCGRVDHCEICGGCLAPCCDGDCGVRCDCMVVPRG